MTGVSFDHEPADGRTVPRTRRVGPTNNLVALGNHLRERGIRTAFVIEESFESELAGRGFEERLMRMAAPPEGEEAVGGGWAEFVRETSPQFRRPTIEQLEIVTAPIWGEFVDDSLDRTSHRVIVSMGPLHDQLMLGDRMWGEQFVPQTAIVPQCDVMITHGGNNTVGEAFTFVVPTIVLPLFWDQYDNAQRIDECGYGVRLSTYEYTDDELYGTIDRLGDDQQLAKRLAAASKRLQASPGRVLAADLIEKVIRR